jgi:hypothetical protein
VWHLIDELRIRGTDFEPFPLTPPTWGRDVDASFILRAVEFFVGLLSGHTESDLKSNQRVAMSVTPTQGKILRTLASLRAFDEESRVERRRVVEEVVGVSNADNDCLNRDFDTLRNRGLMQGKRGPGGGIWLTQDGKQIAESTETTNTRS